MNSLYGKFGMKPAQNIVEIYDTTSDDEKLNLHNTLEVCGETVNDQIQIGHHVVIVRKNLSNVKYDEENDLFHGADINVGIASMITSAARMHMSQFKNNPKYKLYYSDTDSIVIDQPLSEEKVGNALGQLKLEYEISRAVFLAPKVYGFISTDGEEVIKVKGISKQNLKDLHLPELSSLLFENARMEFTQEKWFKKIIEGDITIQQVAYNLRVTTLKRAPIYINGLYSKTRPFNYNEVIK
jgi:DNA polymerase type B, organellar and viral